MKLTIIFTLAFLVFLSGTASAWTEGTNLTQTQLDNINASAINRTDISCRGESFQMSNLFIVNEISCLQIKQITNTTYRIVRQPSQIVISVQEVIWCIATKGLSACQVIYESEIIRELNEILESSRNTIRAYQTAPYQNIVRNWIIEIFGGWR